MGLVLKLFALLIATMFAGGAAVLGGTRLTSRDPFAPYMRIMPGHSIEALDDYSCQLLVVMIDDIEVGYCQFHPKDGVFSDIAVVESNHIITELDFRVISFKISLGDRILCWGTPHYMPPHDPQKGVEHNLYWDNQMYALISPFVDLEHPDYFMPVMYFSLTAEGQPIDDERLLCR